MKKIFAVMFAVLFIGAGVAFACNPVTDPASCQTATTNVYGNAASNDFSFSATYNDWAAASANGFSFAGSENSAKGLTWAQTGAGISAYNFSDTGTSAVDYGTSSHTHAGAFTHGDAYAGGYAYGDGGMFNGYYGGQDGGPGWYEKQHGATAGEVKYFKNGHPQPQDRNEWLFLGQYKGEGYCGPQESFSFVGVGGSVHQANLAAEVGYSGGQGIVGGSQSGASFLSQGWNKMTDPSYASTSAGLGYYGYYWYYDRPYANTWGHTSVSIDPYGPERSFGGYTEAASYTSPGNYYGWYYNPNQYSSFSSNVYGEGAISGMVAKDGSFAAANGSFGFNGFNYGYGYSTIAGNVQQYGNTSSVNASGYSYSHASGNGFNGFAD